MATLIPSRSTCLSRMTSGERRFSSRLDDKLDDEYLCWYDVPIGPRYRHPDFFVLHPSRGPGSGGRGLEGGDDCRVDRDRAVINTDRGRVPEANLLRQARDYAMEIVRLLQNDPALSLRKRRQRRRRMSFYLLSEDSWPSSIARYSIESGTHRTTRL